MRVLDGDQFRVRIFLGESDTWRHTPFARALLERLRAEGFAGATVIHGVAGFGASSVIHTAALLDLSTDLPVVIEVVDDQPHVDRLLPILDEMIVGGAGHDGTRACSQVCGRTQARADNLNITRLRRPVYNVRFQNRGFKSRPSQRLPASVLFSVV